MDIISIFVLILAGVLFVILAWLYMSKNKLSIQYSKIQNKLTAVESHYLSLQAHLNQQHQDKKPNYKISADQSHTQSNEILDLHKEFKTRVPFSDFEEKITEILSLKEELIKYKMKSTEFEKQQKSNISKIITLQEKLKIAEQEIKKWNASNLSNKIIESSNLV